MTPNEKHQAVKNLIKLHATHRQPALQPGGLTATCNCCDRIIFEDENDMDAYTEDGRGYCKECREGAGI